jgi:PAS domain S-box-containing protein
MQRDRRVNLLSFRWHRRTDGVAGGGQAKARLVPRFVAAVGALVAIQLVLLASSIGAIDAISATRAYEAVASGYANAGNQAAASLHRYAVSGDEIARLAFRRALASPLSDRLAREALEAPEPVVTLAYADLVRAGSDPRDVRSMARLFTWCFWWQPTAEMLDHWRQADRLVGELARLGDVVRQTSGADAPGAAERGSALRDVDALNRELSQLTEVASRRLGKISRGLRGWVITALIVGSIAVWATGITLSWRVYRNGMRSERRFRDFAKVTSDWFWETDAQGRVAALSNRAGDASSRAAHAFVGKSLGEIAANFADDPMWRAFRENVAGRLPFHDLCLRRTNDRGERYWSISGTPIHDETGAFAGFCGIANDITGDMQARQHLQDAKEMAEAASRAKSEFLANMSHELRTPLNAILGFAEIIRDRLLGPIGDPRYAEYAHDIHSSGNHLLRIINDILDLSKVEAGRLDLVEEPVDVQEIVGSVVVLLRERVARAGLAFKVDLPGTMLLVRADERKLKQVLMNLLSNAVKFTPAGGEVAIKATIDDHRGLILEVHDTGIGIAPGDLARAMSPFGQVDSRLSRRYEGTGLGLPLAKAFAELHGGTLELDSTPGEGTVARIILPPDRLVGRDMKKWAAG